MSSGKALALVVTIAICVAISWITVAPLTAPFRAIATALLTAGFGALLIWFAKSDAHAWARGVLAVAATCLSAPLAGLAALQNDFFYALLTDLSDPAGGSAVFDAEFGGYEAALSFGLIAMLVGLVAGVILAIIGFRMHRRATARMAAD